MSTQQPAGAGAGRAARWTGALLVGGRSRRMGTDKLLLEVPGGGRLLEHPAGLLRETCRDLFAVGLRSEHAPFLAGFRPLDDALEGAGPIGGLLAALEAATTPWVLLLAADMPDLGPQLLRDIQRAAEADPARALIPRGPTGLEPLAAAYPAALSGAVRERLEGGERAVHRALRLEQRRVWPYEDSDGPARLRNPFRSLNGPEDWQAFAGAPGTTRPSA